jgi:hypothetical protein
MMRMQEEGKCKRSSNRGRRFTKSGRVKYKKKDEEMAEK